MTTSAVVPDEGADTVQDEGRRRSTVNRRKRSGALFYLLAVIFTLPSILPLLWLVSTASKSYIETQTLPPELFPSGFNTENFAALLAPRILGFFMNSVIVTASVVVLVLLLALPASYALVRLGVRKSRDIQFWIISLRMLPPMAVVVPVYILFSAVRLNGSLVAIICMSTMINASFAVWLFSTFFEEVPIEIEEAAFIDGLGRMQTLMRITIPLARTGILTVMGFVFIFAWNELPFALVLSGQLSQTFPVYLSTFTSTNALIDYGQMAAACVLYIAPVILVTALLQRHLTEGLSFGAVK